MSSDEFSKQEAAIVISTLLRCAVIFGYEPKPSDFSGRTSSTIRRLTKFLMEKLGTEEEVRDFLNLYSTYYTDNEYS